MPNWYAKSDVAKLAKYLILNRKLLFELFSHRFRQEFKLSP